MRVQIRDKTFVHSRRTFILIIFRDATFRIVIVLRLRRALYKGGKKGHVLLPFGFVVAFSLLCVWNNNL